ncbi:MAG: transposase [Chlamydiia bacterium]|nr:transposase [Chlamydiia bacterium]
MSRYEPLTDLQWQLLEPLFPNPPKRSRGKPHTPWRAVVNSILLVLMTKSKWTAIPEQPDFATKSAAHRWFSTWEKTGFLDELLATYSRMTSLAADIKLPPRRNRSSPSQKTADLPFTVAAESVAEI